MFCVQVTLLFKKAPQGKTSHAGHSHVLKRSHKVLPLSEKMKVLNKEKKKLYAEVTTIYTKNKSSLSEIVKREKEIPASFHDFKLQRLQPQGV